MRIDFINTEPAWGGGEKWTLEVAVALAGRGHRVRVWGGEDGPLAAKAAEAGIAVREMPRGLRRRWAARGQLRREAIAGDPQVVLAQNGHDFRLARGLYRSTARPALVLRRGLDRSLGGGWLRRVTLRDLALVITNSEATRATILKSLPWLDPERVVTVYNPVDLESLRRPAEEMARADLGLPPAVPVVGIFARLVLQKGHAVLLEALAELEKQGTVAWLLIGGRGPQEAALRRQAARIGLGDRCLFLGHLDHVPPYLRLCDVVVVPSIFEGFGYSAVEAQAVGRPVVGSRASSLPEVVAEGRSGILVEPGEPRALATALGDLLTDPSRRQSMGREGERFVERFAAPRIFDELERLFLSLTRPSTS